MAARFFSRWAIFSDASLRAWHQWATGHSPHFGDLGANRRANSIMA